MPSTPLIWRWALLSLHCSPSAAHWSQPPVYSDQHQETPGQGIYRRGGERGEARHECLCLAFDTRRKCIPAGDSPRKRFTSPPAKAAPPPPQELHPNDHITIRNRQKKTPLPPWLILSDLINPNSCLSKRRRAQKETMPRK